MRGADCHLFEGDKVKNLIRFAMEMASFVLVLYDKFVWWLYSEEK